MAREIHDTLAQGLIGIVTQLEAADQARRPADRDRHLAMPSARPREPDRGAPVCGGVDARSAGAGALPMRSTAVAREWSELNGIPTEVRVTGEVIALHPEIEVALLRIAPGGAGQCGPACRRDPRRPDPSSWATS